MTFGQLLRELLNLTGTKSVNLASELGYDVSYISKWLNDAKRPSIRSTGAICRKIAHFLAANCSERAADQLCQRFQLNIGVRSTGMESRLEDVLTILLKSALSDKLPQPASSSLCPGEGNCTMLRHSEDILTLSIEAIARHFSREENETGVLDVIFMLPLSGPFSSYRQFFYMLDEHNANHPARMKLHWLLRGSELEENPVLYCRCISTVLESLQELQAQLYIIEDSTAPLPPELMLIKDSLLAIKLPGFHPGQSSAMASAHPQIIWEAYLQASTYLEEVATPVQRVPTDDLVHSRCFFAFLMSAEFSCLLKDIQLFHLPDSLWKILHDRCDSPGCKKLLIQFRNIYHSSHVHTILYKSALINYIFEGEIHFLNFPIFLSPEERRQHLLSLARRLETDPAFQMPVLEDDNPYLPADELHCSLFFSADKMFTLRFAEDGKAQSSNFSSRPLIQAFQTTFDQILSEGQDYLMNRESLIAFLRRGADSIAPLSGAAQGEAIPFPRKYG